MRTQTAKSLRFTLSLAGLALAMLSQPLSAGKPGGGGGSGTETIYFNYQGLTNAMNTDGSGKTSLPAGVSGYPSRLLHGGKRWFLQTANIGTETYPDGRQRRELFAIPHDGSAAVQLTNDPGLQLLHHGGWKWLPGEAAGGAVIGGFARRWNSDGSVGFEEESVGLYAAELLFDGSGKPMMPAEPPFFLVSAGVFYESGNPWPDIYGWDFSPDLSHVVADRHVNLEIRIITVASGLSRTLYSGNSAFPTWSPDGSRIAFWLSSPALVYGAIGTISPDGSGYKTNVKALAGTSVYWPYWSPDSASLLYTKDTSGGWNFIYDVYRVGARGGSQVNLTSDLPYSADANAWR